MSRQGLIPLFGFLLLAGLFAFGLTRDPSDIPTEMLDKPFPDFTMSALDNPQTRLSEDMFQNEVTLVNIFGSWCVACVQEHPKLMELSGTGVRLVGVDWRDTREKGSFWLKKHGNPYEAVIFDDTSQLAIDLGITGAPESFIVDQSGTIRYKHVGIITDEVWQRDLQPIMQRLQNRGGGL